MTDYNALQCEAAAYAKANAAEERVRQLEAELERLRRELAEFTGAALCALGVNRDESVSPGNQVIAAIEERARKLEAEIERLRKPCAVGAVLEDVAQERARQDARWGQQDHEPSEYFAILAEEVGEAAKEVVEYRFGREEDRTARLLLIREELIQVAAVAAAMVESIDRRRATAGSAA